MKKTVSKIRKITALIVCAALVFTLLGSLPAFGAQGSGVSVYSTVRKLLSEHPLKEGQAYVGYGKANITPLAKDSTGFTGVPLGGYGRETYRIAYVGGKNTNVQQDLYSICVAVMDAEGNIILFDVNDFINVTRYATISKRVSLATGVPVDKIFISASHTHSGPANSSDKKVKGDVNDYNAYQEEQIVKAATDAIYDLYPSDLYIKSVDVVDKDGKNVLNFVRNYDTSKTDYSGKRVAYGNNHGSYYWNANTGKWAGASSYITNHTTTADPELQMIRFEREDNKNVLMCNFQMHTTITGKNSSSVVSADWFGSFRDAVEAAYPNYRVALYQGAAGNLNPSSSISKEQYKVTNNTGKDITYYFNGAPLVFPKGATISMGSFNSSLTANGITLSADEVRRLGSYFCGNKLAEYVTTGFDDLSTFKKVNAGKIKSKKTVFSDYYHGPDEEVSSILAKTIYSLFWSPTDAQLKEIILGTYKFTSTQLSGMKYINETVTEEEIQAVKDNTQISDISDENAATIAKFVKRTHYVINNYSQLYSPGGTYSFYDVSTTPETRFTDVSVFSKNIRQYARNSIISVMGAMIQSHDGGETVVNSPYHANSIGNNRVNNEGKKYSVTLIAAQIGDVSFTSFPGELFDTNAMFTKHNAVTEMNFIMGYSNGSISYIPSAYGHLYTSYESDVTNTRPGTAELWAGMYNDTLCDFAFSDEVYNLSAGQTKALTAANGSPLYNYTDPFDYAAFGARYGDDDLARFSYTVKKVEYKSSNPSVATVDDKGVITAVSNGTARITVTHTCGNALMDVTDSAACTVIVGGHTHCVVCGDPGCAIFDHSKREFIKWTSSDSLPEKAGRYYLENDVTLSATAEINEDIILCLNGKTVTAAGDEGVLKITGGTFTLCDCAGAGTVKATGSISGKNGIVTAEDGKFVLNGGSIDAAGVTGTAGLAIYVAEKGSVTVNGGTVAGGKASASGGAIYSLGILKITGGTVIGGTAEFGGAIYADCEFELSGGLIQGGGANYGGCLFVKGESSIISGGTVNGGNAIYGGGVAVDSYSSLIITGGEITQSVAQKGGGIFQCSASSVKMSGGTVSHSKAVASSGAYGGNVYVNSTAKSPSSFELTGGTLMHGMTEAVAGNIFVTAYAVLNMSGGRIESGVASHGGNVYCSGVFNLSGGAVTDGTATKYGGGNVSLNTVNARMNMSGGAVYNGRAAKPHAGSIYIWNNAAGEVFNMTGGIISDDTDLARRTGYYGGGIYLADKNLGDTPVSIDRTIKISGSARITGNIHTQIFDEYSGKTSNTYSNVYLESGKYITVGDINLARIGVTLQNGTGVFAENGAAYRAEFVSDEGRYVVKNGDGLALSDTPDTEPDPAAVRTGAPSDVPLPDPDSILPEPTVEKDDFIHLTLEAGGSLDLASAFSGVTGVSKTSDGECVSLDGTVVTGVSGGAETFAVTCGEEIINCAVAVGHYHCLECGTFGCQVHENYLFAPSETVDFGTQANVYLTGDCAIETAVAIVMDDNVKLCLNGHTVTGGNNTRIFELNSTDSTLSVTDCSADECGAVVSNAGADTENDAGFEGTGGLMTVAASNTVNLYRGTLDASGVLLSDSTSLGRGAAVYLYGEMNMYGGSIIGGNTRAYGGAIFLESTAVMNMYGGRIEAGAAANGGCMFLQSTTKNSVRTAWAVFNMYGGTLDASGDRGIRYGGVFYNKGDVNIWNGTMIGSNTLSTGYGGVLQNAAGGVFTMNGGVMDSFNVVAVTATSIMNLGTVIINNGRIIGGTATRTSDKSSPYYNSTVYYGAIVLRNGSTFTLNGGVIQDGTALKEVKYNEAGTASGVVRHCGNIYAVTGSKLNINGGIIYGGTAYGTGGNIYSESGSTITMTGGVIANGRAYKSYYTATANGDGIGGNIMLQGTMNLSGGVIEGGACYGPYGGNITIYSTNGVLNMTGGVIKNGAAATGGGNIAVWYHAGKLDGTKIAFDMSGGTVTCDEDYVKPIGLYASGVGVVPNPDGYHDRVRISGSAVIAGNKDADLHVFQGTLDEIIIGELNEDALICVYASFAGRIAHGVPESSLSRIKTGPGSGDYGLVYDAETGRLNSVSMPKANANAFIESYLTLSDGGYITDPDSDEALYLRASGALEAWNALSEEDKFAVNTVYGELTGVKDIEKLLLEAEKHCGTSTHIVFCDTYLSNNSGSYYDVATEENYKQILEAEKAYGMLPKHESLLANRLIGRSVFDLIAEAKTFDHQEPDAVPGDVSGDGLVTDDDAVYLLFYTFFPEDYPLNQSGDFNGDGLVTDDDAVYLLFYTFFPEDYPLNQP